MESIPRAKKQLLWVMAAVPVVITLLAYLPLSQNDFVNWDDGETIIDNFHLRHFGFDLFKWAFTSFYASNWMPLTWIALSLDYGLGGLNAAVFHWGNLLLHLLNIVLVFRLARQIFILSLNKKGEENLPEGRDWILPAAFLTALIFGVHPINVESVAWASECSNVLYSAFYLSSLLAYLNYAKRETRAKKEIIPCLIFFLMAVLSKPMAVSLPFVLIILDIWPLKRFKFGVKTLLWEKIPFFVIITFLGFLTVYAQGEAGAAPTLQKLTLSLRLANVIHAPFFYLQKLLIPVHFSAIYPIDFTEKFFSAGNLSVIFLVLFVSWVAFVFQKSRPYLFAAWLYYLVSVAPVSGILQVGAQAAADRFSYLPTLGPLMLFSSWVASIFSNRRIVFWFLTAILTLVLGVETSRQVEVWKNSFTLWGNVIHVFPDSEIGYWYLGFAYRNGGDPTNALAAFEKSISINPGLAVTHFGKALALGDLGRVNEALDEFEKSIAIDPTYAQPHINLSVLYQKLGKYDEAIREGEKAVAIGPPSAQAYNNLGVSYGYKGQLGQAINAFQQAVALEPKNSSYQNNLAAAYSMQKK